MNWNLLYAAELAGIWFALVRVVVLITSGRLRGEQGPQGPAGPKGETGPAAEGVTAPAATGVRRDLVEVLKKSHDGWAHYGWVELHSHAYDRAMSDPGFAVIRHGEDLDIGQ